MLKDEDIFRNKIQEVTHKYNEYREYNGAVIKVIHIADYNAET